MKNQRGYLLIEAFLVLGLLAIILPKVFQVIETQRDRDQASEVGLYVAQVTHGVRAFLSDQGDDALATLGCTSGSLCLQNGANWLKDSVSCPEATVAAVVQPYLPCGAPNEIFGRDLKTYIFERGDERHAVIYIGTFTDRNNPNQPRKDLANRAASAANAEQTTTGAVTVAGPNPATPLAGAFFMHYVYDKATQTWTYNQTTEAVEPEDGELVSEASTTSGLDIYLRTDGSNAMQADLDLNGFNLINANGVYRGCVPGEDANNDGVRDADGAPCAEIPVTMNDVFLTSIGQRASEGIYDVVLAQHNTAVPKPSCPFNTTPQLHIALNQASVSATPGGPALPLTGITAYQLDCNARPQCPASATYKNDGFCCKGVGAGNWQVKIRASTPGEQPESLDSNNPALGSTGFASAFIKCEAN